MKSIKCVYISEVLTLHYNHYWAFDKGLKNLGIESGCYVEGDTLLGEDKTDIYPQNSH